MLTQWSKVGLVCMAILFAKIEYQPIVSAAGEPQKTASCLGPEYRQFDFWVGDWDVFESDGVTKVAHVKVERILNGCVLEDRYEDANGLNGRSLTIYDAPRRLWHQTWVTNRGRLLIISGKKQAEQMVLSGAYRDDNDNEIQVQGTWKPVSGGVHETAVTSADGGASWKQWFDLIFRPRDNASASVDAKVVADLDTQYQAAVKANDAVNMDRILADDFVLVTGAGKVYTKSTLLDHARSGSTTYEHQEDSEQIVRVWGDTAVVTARLWEKGTEQGKPFDRVLWFSDTYARTPAGWKYVLGQASLHLPK